MRRAAAYLAIVVAVALLATFSRWSPERFWVSVAIQILISGLFAMSLDVLVGYAGLPSLGHAAFFGVGAYAYALLAKRITPMFFVALPGAALAAALAALAIGLFSVRASGIFFLMLTLAFAQMLYALAFGWIPVTGGSDGLSGVPRPDLGVAGTNLFLTVNFYIFVAVVFLLSVFLLRVVVTSRFGLALAGVRENERRMRALGYDTARVKLATNASEGCSTSSEVVPSWRSRPSTITPMRSASAAASWKSWVTSSAGSASSARTFLSDQPLIGARWETILGLLFIATVLFARRGLIGVARATRRRAWLRSS